MGREGKGLTPMAEISHAVAMNNPFVQLLFTVAIACASPTGAAAQEWSNNRVSEMLVTELSPTGAMVGGKWFTSAQNLTLGVRALGIIYAHVPGSAGTASIHAASFYWTGTGWQKYSDIPDLYGMSPVNAVFEGDRATLTTVTLGPNEPRCCPTLEKHWSIDLATGDAVPTN